MTTLKEYDLDIKQKKIVQWQGLGKISAEAIGINDSKEG